MGPSAKEKPSLSRHKVLQQAVELANRDGVAKVSMRAVASALNVEAMSLYNHVKNKDDLLSGMVDTVVKKFEKPCTELPWKQAMRQCVVSTHEELLKHPWAAMLLISRVNVEDGLMSYSNACFGCFVDAGFSYPMADHAWNAVSNHLYGFTLSEVSMPVSAKHYAQAAKQYLPMVPQSDYPHIYNMMQLIIKGDHSGVNDFTFGLDLILDGLEAKLNSEGLTS